MKERKILKNKAYLYLTEFFAGMAVMAVELGASRLLAPYFSSSQIVWTIIISTIMIAMALGNIYGGRSADKNPDPDRLYRRLLIAAVWTAAIPVLGKYIILLITGILIVTINSNLLIAAGFLACMVIFVFPCFLLGTVTPSLTKYAVRSLDDSGSTVGRLGAANTVGSIIGTFTPTFITIPTVGTSVTFLIFSGILLALAMIYFISAHTGKCRCLVSVILFVLCSVFGHSGHFAFWNNSLAYEGESIYNYLQVQEDKDTVILSTNVLFGIQSISRKDGSLTGMYYDYAMAAPVMAGFVPDEEVSEASGKESGSGDDSAADVDAGAQAKSDAGDREESRADDACDILILGNGSGTYAKECANHFPDAKIQGVEIDQKITDLAGRYFDMPDSVKVAAYDGRAYLEADRHTYDVIMVDAYQDISVPFQMSSVEFFNMVREHLKPNGVMVVNMNMRASGEKSINSYLSGTISAVFPSVYTVDVKGYTNRELFALNEDLDADTLNDRLDRIGDPDLKALLKKVCENLRQYRRGDLLLTDDKAPVELLSMRAIDQIINDELAYYKKLFREKGIQGVLNEL
ncbi:spermidine synthase [Bilifractor sp. LCP21S3_A7]|uniref:spermidine synthase n=1 Tax=Bilifractor sp. LCP21S3_A7 TaxID=3438738 RepID=UPI003F8F9018